MMWGDLISLRCQARHYELCHFLTNNSPQEPKKIMKKTYILTTLAGLALASMSATAGTTIYTETFIGNTGALNGATTTEGGGTWSAGPYMTHDGALPVQGKQLAYLDFTPDAGNVYTLSMDLAITGSADWFGFGFSELNTQNVYFYQINSSAWILNETAGNVNTYLGPNTANIYEGGNIATLATNNLKVVLDTTETLWSVAYYVNDGLVNEATYTVNPTISYVALGKANGGLTGQMSNLSLTAAVPEPGTYALLAGALALASVMVRRRR